MGSAPNLDTIGGRLKSERERLGYSQPAFVALVGMTKSAQIQWEAGRSYPTVDALATWAAKGLDVTFVVTGKRADQPIAVETAASLTVRQALAMLDPVDRHRLLLDLLATELRG